MRFLIYANAEVGDNKHTSEAYDVSLVKVDPIDVPKDKTHGLYADAGGGGTRKGVAKKSPLVDRNISLMDFLTTTGARRSMKRMI